jgi:hypothetical protein
MLPGAAGSSELHADSNSSDVSTLALVARSRIFTSGLESENGIMFTRLSLVGGSAVWRAGTYAAALSGKTRQA